jgi:hypothetical protein
MICYLLFFSCCSLVSCWPASDDVFVVHESIHTYFYDLWDFKCLEQIIINSFILEIAYDLWPHGVI